MKKQFDLQQSELAAIDAKIAVMCDNAETNGTFIGSIWSAVTNGANKIASVITNATAGANSDVVTSSGTQTLGEVIHDAVAGSAGQIVMPWKKAKPKKPEVLAQLEAMADEEMPDLKKLLEIRNGSLN
ncbi:hypothetical protein [Flavobacterium sp. 3HN19-14]|uniref:hypothetical protein n=1 Tax=Flavobacterium sp. 3HN19-14 TaxID=3448133 RepID=UPI003EDED5B2